MPSRDNDDRERLHPGKHVTSSKVGLAEPKRLQSATVIRRVAAVTFSVIVPTRGRPSLLRTLASIVEQLEPGDEVLVLRDDSGDVGDTPRNGAIPRARGTHLLFMDDDDQYAKGALANIRRFAEEHPGRIGIFRMRFDHGLLLWRQPVLEFGNVSTQLFVVPNIPGKLARWEQRGRVIGDYVFITETAKLQGDPIFRDEIVVFARTDRRLIRRSLTRIRKLPVRFRYHARRSRVRRLLARLR
jgi:glycosyltransferase involved in cell wall biosynthesis